MPYVIRNCLVLFRNKKTCRIKSSLNIFEENQFYETKKRNI